MQFAELDYNRLEVSTEAELVALNQKLGKEVDSIQAFRKVINKVIAGRKLKEEHDKITALYLGNKAVRKDAVAEGQLFNVGVAI